MDDSLFRKVSLERLSSPEQIDQLMKIRGPSGWIALTAAFILLGMGCIWLAFGKVPVTVPCDGSIMPVAGLSEVQTSQTVSVEKIEVRAGDRVKKNEILIKGKEVNDDSEFYIESPISGVITDIFVNEGSVAMQGETLIRMEPDIENVSSGLCAVMTVSVDDGVRLRGGEKAFISPSGINLDKYGYIKGKVESVSRYPKNELQNVEVRVMFNITDTGNLDYSYGRVPKELPYGGTPCTGYIQLGYKTPMELVLPWLAAKD